jgi:hypothetical protein
MDQIAQQPTKRTKKGVPGIEAGLVAAARIAPNGVKCEQAP